MKKKIFWDQLGVSVSLVCVIHCIILPVMLAVLPLWSLADAVHSWAHPVLLIMIVPLAYLSNRSKPSSSGTKILFIVGISILVIAWLTHDFIRPPGEVLITLAGSILLIIAHFKNYKLHRAYCTKSSICRTE